VVETLKGYFAPLRFYTYPGAGAVLGLVLLPFLMVCIGWFFVTCGQHTNCTGVKLIDDMDDYCGGCCLGGGSLVVFLSMMVSFIVAGVCLPLAIVSSDICVVLETIPNELDDYVQMGSFFDPPPSGASTTSPSNATNLTGGGGGNRSVRRLAGTGGGGGGFGGGISWNADFGHFGNRDDVRGGVRSNARRGAGGGVGTFAWQESNAFKLVSKLQRLERSDAFLRFHRLRRFLEGLGATSTNNSSGNNGTGAAHEEEGAFTPTAASASMILGTCFRNESFAAVMNLTSAFPFVDLQLGARIAQLQNTKSSREKNLTALALRQNLPCITCKALVDDGKNLDCRAKCLPLPGGDRFSRFNHMKAQVFALTLQSYGYNEAAVQATLTKYNATVKDNTTSASKRAWAQEQVERIQTIRPTLEAQIKVLHSDVAALDAALWEVENATLLLLEALVTSSAEIDPLVVAARTLLDFSTCGFVKTIFEEMYRSLCATSLTAIYWMAMMYFATGALSLVMLVSSVLVKLRSGAVGASGKDRRRKRRRRKHKKNQKKEKKEQLLDADGNVIPQGDDDNDDDDDDVDGEDGSDCDGDLKSGSGGDNDGGDGPVAGNKGDGGEDKSSGGGGKNTKGSGDMVRIVEWGCDYCDARFTSFTDAVFHEHRSHAGEKAAERAATKGEGSDSDGGGNNNGGNGSGGGGGGESGGECSDDGYWEEKSTTTPSPSKSRFRQMASSAMSHVRVKLEPLPLPSALPSIEGKLSTKLVIGGGPSTDEWGAGGYDDDDGGGAPHAPESGGHEEESVGRDGERRDDGERYAGREGRGARQSPAAAAPTVYICKWVGNDKTMCGERFTSKISFQKHNIDPMSHVLEVSAGIDQSHRHPKCERCERELDLVYLKKNNKIRHQTKGGARAQHGRFYKVMCPHPQCREVTSGYVPQKQWDDIAWLWQVRREEKTYACVNNHHTCGSCGVLVAGNPWTNICAPHSLLSSPTSSP